MWRFDICHKKWYIWCGCVCYIPTPHNINGVCVFVSKTFMQNLFHNDEFSSCHVVTIGGMFATSQTWVPQVSSTHFFVKYLHTNHWKTTLIIRIITARNTNYIVYEPQNWHRHNSTFWSLSFLTILVDQPSSNFYLHVNLLISTKKNSISC